MAGSVRATPRSRGELLQWFRIRLRLRREAWREQGNQSKREKRQRNPFAGMGVAMGVVHFRNLSSMGTPNLEHSRRIIHSNRGSGCAGSKPLTAKGAKGLRKARKATKDRKEPRSSDLGHNKVARHDIRGSPACYLPCRANQSRWESPGSRSAGRATWWQGGTRTGREESHWR